MEFLPPQTLDVQLKNCQEISPASCVARHPSLPPSGMSTRRSGTPVRTGSGPPKTPIKTPTSLRNSAGATAASRANAPSSGKKVAGTGDKRDLVSAALAAATVRPPVEDMLVRFAQRLGARQYDIRGNSALLRPLIMDTLVTWCATSPQHKCVPLMLQATAALAGMAMADAADAQLMIDQGILPVLMAMMQHGVAAPPDETDAAQLAREAKLEARLGKPKKENVQEKVPVSKDPRMTGPLVSASGIPWRRGAGDSAITAVWALIQSPNTVHQVVAVGAIRPLCALCLQATEAKPLMQSTAALRDVAITDYNRETVLEHGGLEALALCLDKCQDQLMVHLERDAPTLRKHVTQALQNLTLSYKVRQHFIESGLVQRLMELCLMADMDKKLTTPNHVLGYAIAAIANVSHLPEAKPKLLDLGVAIFLTKMLDLCKNGLVTIHVSIAIKNLALRRASPDFQSWLTDKDERNQLEFGAANALQNLVAAAEKQLPPNNDNKVLEHVLNALIALLWNSPKNRLRMSNKEIIDLNVLTKLAAAGKELTAIIRQRLAILLADLAQLPSVQQRLAELGLLATIFDWILLPPAEAVTRYCAGGAVMNMVANEANSTKFGKAVMPDDPSKSLIAALADVLRERPITDSLLMNVCGLMANLSCKNDSNRVKVMQAGIVGDLIAYLNDEGKDPSLVATEGSLRRNIMIGALLQNLTAGPAFRAKIVAIGGVKVLMQIVMSGKNKNMVRYALGALRNLANETPIQRQLVDEGLLDACVYISTLYSESDTFEDASTPTEHAASIIRNLCGNDQIRHNVRQNNALQMLSKQLDPASKNVCEDYVRRKPDLNPAEVMVPFLSSNGDVNKELCGSTDDSEPRFPTECAHLEQDVDAQAAFAVILDMMNQLWLKFEAPRPDTDALLAQILESEAVAKRGTRAHRDVAGGIESGAHQTVTVEKSSASPTSSARSQDRIDMETGGFQKTDILIIDERALEGELEQGGIERSGRDELQERLKAKDEVISKLNVELHQLKQRLALLEDEHKRGGIV